MSVTPTESLSPVKRALATIARLKRELADAKRDKDEPIAVIGMSCRLPGEVRGPEDFWRLMTEGRDATRELDEVRQADAGLGMQHWWSKLDVLRGGYQQQVDRFDAYFFGISPREAASLDPQQRWLLELSWEALEDAGIAAERLRGGQVGWFAGLGGQDYSQLLHADPAHLDAQAATGVAPANAVGRLAYFYDTHGPAAVVEGACASSLLAVHQACLSLRAGDCELALAGGVNLITSPMNGLLLDRLQALAPDGRCKTFDAAADGYARGEGGGLVVLKPLDAALRDGDPIRAVICGSAVNQDGRSNGLTAPNGLAQTAVMQRALARADVSADLVGFLETHGTGTSLGDPIELEAIREVYGEGDLPLLLGAAKTHVGHLEAAAGVTGLIKAILCLMHGETPPNLHFESLNPHIRLGDSRLALPRTQEPFPALSQRYAAVSAFGMNGCNAHLILSQAPELEEVSKLSQNEEHLLVISARTPESLDDMRLRYADFLRETETEFSAICRAAALGRSHLSCRLALVAQTAGEASQQLISQPKALIRARAEEAQERVVWVCTGQGPQWWPFDHRWIASEPKAHDIFKRCEAWIMAQAGWSLSEALSEPREQSRLNRISHVQVAMFSVQATLAAWYQAMGVACDAVIGHSLGEVAAAYISGSLTLEDALSVAHHRGRLIESLCGRGQSLFIDLPRGDVEPLLKHHQGSLFLAAENGPSSVVVSGDQNSIEAMIAVLDTRGVFARKLDGLMFACHCPRVDPVLDPLRHALRHLTPRACKTPMISTVTGRLIEGETLDGDYWARNVRRPVMFRAGIETLVARGRSLFLELGAHPLMRHPISRMVGSQGAALSSLQRDRKPWEALLGSLGELYVHGVAPDWRTLHSSAPFVRLPSYAWRHERHWFDITANEVKPVPIQPTQTAKHVVKPPEQSHPPALSWRELDPDQQARALGELVLERVGEVLGLPVNRVERHRPLREQGMDSLMAYELKSSLDRDLSWSPSVAKLVGGATPDQVHQQALSNVRPREENLPRQASWFQRDFWLYDRMCRRLRPTFLIAKISALSPQTFDQVVRRRPVLRTLFSVKDDELLISYLPDSAIVLEHCEIPGYELSQTLTQYLYARFDLGQGPLFRAVQLDISDERLEANDESVSGPLLLLMAHPSLLDRQSLKLLLAELNGGDFNRSTSSYQTFSRRQERLLQGNEGAELYRFWRERLQQSITPLEVAPRPNHHTYAVIRRSVPSQTWHKFAEYRLMDRIIWMLTTWRALLFLETGHEDLPMGFLSDRRADFENVLGCFINTLVMRGPVTADATFESLKGDTAELIDEVRRHGDYPFLLLVHQLATTRHGDRNPFFQIMFHYEDRRDEHFEPLEPPMPLTTAIGLQVLDCNDRAEMEISYDPNFIETKGVERLMQHLLWLTEHFLNAWRTPFAHIELPDLSRPLIDQVTPEQRLVINDRVIATSYVEQILEQHPAIRQAMLKLTEKGPVAYIVPDLVLDRVNLLIKCEVGSNRWFLGENLSARGICLLDPDPHWRVGHHLNIRLVLPGLRRSIRVEGNFVWLARNRAGVAFLSDPIQQSMLQMSMSHVLEMETGSLGLDLSQFRLSLSVPCRVTLDSGELVQLTAENLYLEGVRVKQPPEAWEPGLVVTLSFDMEPIDLQVRAELIWSNQVNAGFRFVCGAETRDRLQAYFIRFLKQDLLSARRLDAWLRQQGLSIPLTWLLLEPDQDLTAPPLLEPPHLEPPKDPRTPLEGLIAGIWRDVLGVQEPGIYDHFVQSGGQSMDAVAIIQRIDDEFEVHLSPAVLFECPTIAQLSATVEQEMRMKEQGMLWREESAEAPNPWLRPLKRNDDAPIRLFCFAHLGGDGSVYRELFRDLQNVDVWGIQLPGRGERLLETPFTSFFSVIQALEKAVQPFLDRPYVFFGQSMGCLYAFELARHLRRRNRPEPARLFLSAMCAPQMVGVNAAIQELRDVSDLTRDLDGTEIQDQNTLDFTMPLLRADMSLLKDYVYVTEPPLDIPVTIFGGQKDPIASPKDLEAWRDHTTADFEVKTFVGSHFFMFSHGPSFTAHIAEKLQDLVEQ